jgi:hypothetical protein
VHVRSNNGLLLGFAHSYKVELNRINSERDLLAWTITVPKLWMRTENTEMFLRSCAKSKDSIFLKDALAREFLLNPHLLPGTKNEVYRVSAITGESMC